MVPGLFRSALLVTLLMYATLKLLKQCKQNIPFSIGLVFVPFYKINHQYAHNYYTNPSFSFKLFYKY